VITIKNYVLDIIVMILEYWSTWIIYIYIYNNIYFILIYIYFY